MDVWAGPQRGRVSRTRRTPAHGGAGWTVAEQDSVASRPERCGVNGPARRRKLVRAFLEDKQVFVDLLQLQFGSRPNHVVAGRYQSNIEAPNEGIHHLVYRIFSQSLPPAFRTYNGKSDGGVQ